jgi:hypothetical protein
MRNYLSVFLFVVLHSFCHAQVNDTTKIRLNFSSDLIQTCINEFSGHVECQFNKRNSIGFDIGYIYPRKALRVNFLSYDQGPNPGTVWYGSVYRLNYTHYSKYKPGFFISIRAMYKNLSFHNRGFENVRDDESYFFKRSEYANLGALDVFGGKVMSTPGSWFDFEIFWGGGLRIRSRYGFTSYSRFNDPPVGGYFYHQFYPMVVFGMRIGFNVFIRKNLN